MTKSSFHFSFGQPTYTFANSRKDIVKIYNDKRFSDFKIILNGHSTFYLSKYVLKKLKYIEKYLIDDDDCDLTIDVSNHEFELFLEYVTKEKTKFHGDYDINNLHKLSIYFHYPEFDDIIFMNINYKKHDLCNMMVIFQYNDDILNKLMMLYVKHVDKISEMNMNNDLVKKLLNKILSKKRNKNYSSFY